MACNFWTRKAMFIFQSTAPWRCDCHPGLKSRQKAYRGTDPWQLNTQHQASVSSGQGMLLLSSWYIPECHGFPYPNTSWHWRLHRSPSSGVRPGTCTRPRAAHRHGSRQRQCGVSLSESNDMSRLSRMGQGVKGLWLKSILHRKIFSKCLT